MKKQRGDAGWIVLAILAVLVYFCYYIDYRVRSDEYNKFSTECSAKHGTTKNVSNRGQSLLCFSDDGRLLPVGE